MKTAVALALAATLAAQNAATVNVVISNQQNTQAGLNGRLNLYMSTSFQAAGYSYQFFENLPNATAPLASLFPHHIRMQVIAEAVPQTAANIWNFQEIDALMQPVQSVADHSPEFQIAVAAGFLSDANGQLEPANFAPFVEYSGNLIRYYNTGGFDAGGTQFASPTPYPVTWWGIFNEPNINGISTDQYVQLYNQLVPAIKAIDPGIKAVAVELADFGQEPENYIPTFVQNVTAPVDIVATHFYATCNQLTPDLALFQAVPQFASDVRYIRSQLATNPALANVPVWVTENNVNADYEGANGMSTCNPGQIFVTDVRGTDAFFAAWRPYAFSQLGQAGAQSLHHWDFGADQQYSEIDAGTGNYYLSYWVDYYLARMFSAPPGADILNSTSSDPNVDILATRNDDGSAVVMISNQNVHASTDDNGPGDPRTVDIDVSALGFFANAEQITIDASLNPAQGPAPKQFQPMANLSVNLNGYAVTFLRFWNQSPAISPGAIANAASYAQGAVSPGEMISIFGAALGPAKGQGPTREHPRLISTDDAGVRVLFEGVAAPILYASSGQVNAIVPYAVSGKASTDVWIDYLGVSSNKITIPVAPAAPGIFTQNGSGTGPGAIINDDGTSNSPANPAERGHYISIYATGEGDTNGEADGLIAITPARPKNPVTVSIGGANASVEYAGGAPGFAAGLLQVNALIPDSISPGTAVPVEISIAGKRSQTVTMAIK